MDDLRLLAELRSDAPEPDTDRLRAIRARVMRRRRRVMILPAVAALAMAAAVIAVTLTNRTPEPPARLLNTTTALEQAASVAGRRSAAPEPRADQWQYRKYLTVQPADGKTTTFEEWIRYDGKQSAGKDDAGKVGISDVPPDPGDDDLSPQKYRAKLLKLPTDPDELLAHVTGDRHWIDYPREKGVEPPDLRAFRVLSVYLQQQAVMPPKLEAAIYRALARIPGVRVEEGIKDGAGRQGLGVYLEGQDETSRLWLVLDPVTYRLLGERTTFFTDHLGAKAGSSYATAELASGIVDRAGRIP